MSSLFKKLSNVFLINSTAFAGVSPTKQTEVLTGSEGLPVLFVPDFANLSNRKNIRDKLLAGVDVSMELEFNGVSLSEEELRCLSLVRPILEKIGGIGPKYPWLPAAEFANIKIGANKIERSGHTIGKATAKKLWERASSYWAGSKKPVSIGVPTDGYSYNNRTAEFYSDRVVIGCQTITRAEVEYIARTCEWDPVIK